jgi:hypothetical protein
MVLRKFAVGDRVRLSLHVSWNHNPRDVYTISRMLPAQANVWQYRVPPFDKPHHLIAENPQPAGSNDHTRLWCAARDRRAAGGVASIG